MANSSAAPGKNSFNFESRTSDVGLALSERDVPPKNCTTWGCCKNDKKISFECLLNKFQEDYSLIKSFRS